ncbi:MAG: hypothetical protein U5J98_02620 [Halobacteriales archaeon]|nr:hypothetical protein [Halobacteriales archaeon]
MTVANPLKIVERILYPLVVTFDAITRRLNDQLNVERDIAETYLKE